MSRAEARPIDNPAAGRDTEPSDPRLWTRLSQAASREDFAAAWLPLQARAIGDVRAAVLILGSAEAGPFVPVAVLPPRSPVSAELSIAAEMAMTERRGIAHDRPAGDRSEGRQCIALPILLDGELHGVAAFELGERSADALGEAGRRLQWGAAWIEALLRRQSLLPNGQLVEVLDLVALLLEAPSLTVALQSLAVDLARVTKAEWAACGLVRRGTHVGVKAMSQAILTSNRAAMASAVAAAMQEAFDQASIIQLPEPRDAMPVVVQAHRRLLEVQPAGALLSVPVRQGDEAIGVFTVAARAGQAISAADREFLRLAAVLVGPAIRMRARDDRWIGAKLGESLYGFLRRLVGPRHPLLKLGALALVALAAYLSVGTATWRITAPATVEGSVQRAITVPTAGFIAAQGPRAGDRVAKGDVLAKLDDRELQVQLAQATAEREGRLREYQQAFATGERARVEVLRAQIAQAQAQIDLLTDQIARVELRAPIDGIIVQGDLSQMLGAPVQRGDVLFEIAPLDDYRIILKLDERDVTEVSVGREGQLILSSLPTQTLPIEVSKLTPVSTIEGGHNYFRVEARLKQADPAIRPGMQGYGKIALGERPVLFIATNSLVQWLRMTVWRFWF